MAYPTPQELQEAEMNALKKADQHNEDRNTNEVILISFKVFFMFPDAYLVSDITFI